MKTPVRTVIFDLDGTIYQNTAFHRDYLRYLVEGTDRADWAQALIGFADDVFAGKKLVMNRFYRSEAGNPQTLDELFLTIAAGICPPMTYEQARDSRGLIYLGDAWAVMALIGATLGLIGNGRGDQIYRRVRAGMEQEGMRGNTALKAAIERLSKRCDVILLSNSYEDTARAFLEQLGFDGVFEHIRYSANKPFDMIAILKDFNPRMFDQPETVWSIGDHAYNDLMPVSQMGGRTVWINGFDQNVAHPACDVVLMTLDDLAKYLNTIA